MNAPSRHYSLPDCHGANARPFSPLARTKRLTIPRYYKVVGFVSGLLFLSGPPAVARLVVAVVVFSLQSVTRGWSFPHTSKEAFKRAPLIAYRDSTSPVTGKIGAFLVEASLPHANPNCVLWPFTFSVGGKTLHLEFSSKASTTFSLSSTKPCSRFYAGFPAITLTKPARTIAYVLVLSKNPKATKTLSDKIYCSHGCVL